MLLCGIGILLLVIELGYFRVAAHFNIIDKPNDRSSHACSTLRGGGIVFYFGALAFFCVSFFSYPWFILGLTLITAVSFADDVRSLPNHKRIIVQVVAVLFLLYQLGMVTTDNYWMILALLIIGVGMVNVYNFMDGINGITGAYALAVLIPMAIVNRDIHFINPYFIWCTVISVGIFLLFNFRTRAKCFAGDAGAVSVAFILIFLLGKLIVATGDGWYMIFFAVYGADSVLTICHRLMLHENIFVAHRKHLYQIMANEVGIPHTTVATLYSILQILISLTFIFSPVRHDLLFFLTVVMLTITYVIFQKKFYHLHTTTRNL